MGVYDAVSSPSLIFAMSTLELLMCSVAWSAGSSCLRRAGSCRSAEECEDDGTDELGALETFGPADVLQDAWEKAQCDDAFSDEAGSGDRRKT